MRQDLDAARENIVSAQKFQYDKMHGCYRVCYITVSLVEVFLMKTACCTKQKALHIFTVTFVVGATILLRSFTGKNEWL